MQLLPVAAAAGVSQAFGRFTYSVLFTDVRDDLGLTNTAAGAIGAANLGAYVAGTAAVTIFVGRLGLARCLRAGLTVAALSLLAMAWSPSMGVVIPAMITSGFFGAFVWVTAPALAADLVDPAHRGFAIGFTGAGIGIGIALTAVLSSVVADDAWRRIYLIEAGLALIVVAAVYRSLPTGEATGAAPATSGSGGADVAPSSQIGLRTVTYVPAWRGLVAAYGLFAFAMSMVMTFTVAVLESDAGWSRPDAALALTTMGVGMILGGPVFGPASDRYGRARILAVAFALIVATGLVLPLGLYPWSLVLTLAFGMAFTGVPTTVAARIGDIIDRERFGAAFGAATLVFGCGLVLGPPVGGYLADTTGSFTATFALVAVIATIGLILGLLQPGGIRPADDLLAVTNAYPNR